MTASPPVAAPAATIGRRVGAFAIDLGVAYAITAVLVGVAVPVVFGVGATGDSGSLAVAVVLASLVVGGALLAWWLVYSAMQGGCLLYTSPSPRDKRQSRMPSSA